MSPIRLAVAATASVLPLLTAVRLAGWWPCDVACQGGGFYQRFAGIDVLWPALLSYALLAALLWLDAVRRLHWSRFSCATAGLLAGVSLFYVGVAWQLGIVCPFCITIHSVMLAVLLAVAGEAAGTTALCLLFGLLGTNAAFHHTAVADAGGDATTPPAVVLPPSARASRADRNRTLGRAAAPITVAYAFSLQCSHCAEQHQPLLDALAPAIADGRVRVVMRPVIRPADTGSRWLATWAFAAAEQSPERFATFLTEHLSTKATLTREELLTLGGDLPMFDAAATGGVFDDLVASDQQALRGLGYKGSTPFIAVISDGVVRGRFVRDVPLPALVELVSK